MRLIGHQRAFDDTSLVRLNPLDKLIVGQWFTKEEALHLIASFKIEKIELCLGFDALGNHIQSQRMAQRNDCAGNRLVIGIPRNIADERPIYFQTIDRKFLQLRKGRISGTEIVQINRQTKRLKVVKRNSTGLRIVHQQALSDLQFEAVGIEL